MTNVANGTAPTAEECQTAEQDVMEEIRRERRGRVWTEWQGRARDLLDIDTSEPVKWVPGAERIIRAGERQLWFASQGNGKTQAALHLATQVCEAGGYVVYVDMENDEREMAERLQPIAAGLGATHAVAERLLYLPDLDLPSMFESPETARPLVALMTVMNLLVIDSWTRVLTVFGLDENDNKDIARFMQTFPDAMAKSGIAVLILDNTGHEETRPRGAISKQALVESVYRITGGKDVKPDKHGTLSLKLARSRSGKIADWVTAGSGGGSFTPLTAQMGSSPKAGPTMQAAARQEAIAAFLEEHPDQDFTVEALKVKFPGAIGTIRSTMTKLVAENRAQKTRLDEKADHWRFRQR